MAASVDDVVAMVLFGRVVEAQSFTAAAKRMGLSKAAVSARVAQLEKRMGTRLLNRTTRRLSLTEEGLQLCRHCSRLMAEADAAAATALEVGPDLQGTLKVNAPQTLSRQHLAPIIHEFLERHPRVRVDLTVQNSVVDVLHDGYDVVVRLSLPWSNKDANVASRKLTEEELVICGAPSYLERRGRPKHPEDLLGHTCLRYSVNQPQEEWRYWSGGEWKGVPITGRMATNDAEVLLEMCIAGEGLVIGPRFMMLPAIQRGQLERVLPDVQLPRLRVAALFADRKYLPARVRAFVELLAARLPASVRS